METRASYLIVGSFVLLAIAALFGLVIFVAKAQFETATVTYRIYFTGSVTGLQNGSAVRYRGIPVGTVTDIRIDPHNVERVRVSIAVPQATPIKEDAIASLEMQGITGQAYVQITGGTQKAKALVSDDDGPPIIPSRPSALSAVFDAAPQLLDHLITLTDRLSQMVNEENTQAFAQTLSNVRDASGALKQSTHSIDDTIVQLQGFVRDLDKVAKAADGAVAQARQTVAQVGNDANTLTTQFGDAAKDLRPLLHSLKQASDQINTVVAENRQPVHDFTTTGLYQATQLMGELRDLAGNVSRLTDRIERDPTSFLFGGQRKGVTAP
ncbi:MAG: MlaD family protein [Azospirillaceae bacterium]|nr:MlaD family protein [Azospirillaceae bacterium]